MLNGTWRKSSHSALTNCVEVAWRKSSASTANGHCVEVATGEAAIHVRDSKNPAGAVLTFTPQDWAAFLASTKSQPAVTVWRPYPCSPSSAPSSE